MRAKWLEGGVASAIWKRSILLAVLSPLPVGRGIPSLPQRSPTNGASFAVSQPKRRITAIQESTDNAAGSVVPTDQRRSAQPRHLHHPLRAGQGGDHPAGRVGPEVGRPPAAPQDRRLPCPLGRRPVVAGDGDHRPDAGMGRRTARRHRRLPDRGGDRRPLREARWHIRGGEARGPAADQLRARPVGEPASGAARRHGPLRRDGAPIFGASGFHRLGMALSLGFERIPGCLGVVHAEAPAEVIDLVR